MTTEPIVLTEEVEPGIVIVRMNRPDRLNAMSMELIGELHETFARLESDRSVRAIILTGAGRGFCAGLDLKAAGHGAPGTEGMGPIPRTFATQEHIASLNERVHRLRKPVIALACDIRFAAPEATFGAVFITLGVSACDMGTSYFLPRLVGASRSAELLLTGRVFAADEAQTMGLTLEVVDAESLLERALVTARQIVAHSPLAVWMTKETMWQTVDAPSLRHAMDMENRTQVLCTATGDMVEATAAFREGRPARWSDL